MLQRLRNTRNKYPSQFWLLFWGMLISTTGTSMIWPFLMIYVSERLSVSMTTAASLMTINSVAGLVASFIAGPITDRAGRKIVMVFSLISYGLIYLFMSQANTYLAFAILMALTGTVNPLYRIGADAMLADLIPSEKRPDAYALLRMSNNLGISIGPAVGGVIATSSYNLAFYIAFAGLTIFGLLLAFLARETLPALEVDSVRVKEPWGGYDRILKDGRFISMVATFALGWITAVFMWILLPVYAKQNFGIQENWYGLIPTTNALMVVLFQLAVTSITKRYKPLPIMALGMAFYALGTGSVVWGHGFWGFWTSMVVVTIGELILVPTSSTFVANIAPRDMRGRYMSIYGLTWGFASGVGAILGGFLNDHIGPSAIWYGGLALGLCSTLGFVILSAIQKKREQPDEIIKTI